MAVINNADPGRVPPWILSKDDPLKEAFLPEDCYKIIFEIIASTNISLTSIVAFGSINRGFRARYLSSCAFFPMMNALSCIYKSMPVASEPLGVPLPHLDQYFLAADEAGNQYYCSKWDNNRSVLYIINPLNKDLFSLDMKEYLGVDSQIVDCHPNEKNGFILVCKTTVSQWRFTEDTFTAAWCTVPFENEHEIRTSSMLGDTLLLTTAFTLHMLDLRVSPGISSSAKQVHQVPALEGQRCKYLNFNKKTYAFREQMAGQPSAIVQVENIESYEDERDKCQSWRVVGRVLSGINCPGNITTERSQPQLTPMGKYLIQSPTRTHRYITILDQNLQICCGKDMKIRYPQKKSSDSSKISINGMIFIENDFLFVSYPQGDLRVIHLPSKKDWSKPFNDTLAPYLKDRKLFTCSILNDEGKSFFRLLLQPSECPIREKMNQWLEWVDIPFDFSAPIAESRKDQPPPTAPVVTPTFEKPGPVVDAREVPIIQTASMPTTTPPIIPIHSTMPTTPSLPPPSNTRQNQTPKSCCSAQDRLSSWFKNIHPVGKFFFVLGSVLTLSLMYLFTLIGFACVSDENN